jgi:hypothetical protein
MHKAVVTLVALAAMTSMARAEPVALAAHQMDRITAGAPYPVVTLGLASRLLALNIRFISDPDEIPGIATSIRAVARSGQ